MALTRINFQVQVQRNTEASGNKSNPTTRENTTMTKQANTVYQLEAPQFNPMTRTPLYHAPFSNIDFLPAILIYLLLWQTIRRG